MDSAQGIRSEAEEITLSDDQRTILAAAAVFLAIIAAVAAVKAVDMRRAELVASGACQVDRTEWVTPAATAYCSWHDPKSRSCVAWRLNHPEPFKREHWTCPTEEFWLRAQPINP